MIDRKSVFSALAGALIACAIMALASGPLIRAYIIGHPEILPEAFQLMQDREIAKVVNDNRALFETPYGSAWAGARDADVVLVEFFDYACGFCRKSNPDVARLLAEDSKLKVVWREFPVLGPDSAAAAQISLAAAQQGKFRAFHDRLFATARPTPEAVAEAQEAAGVLAAPVTPAMQAELQTNYQLAQAVRASGTPTFVVGDKVLQGAVGYSALKAAIEAARKSKS